MELTTVEIPRAGAREAARDYRRAARDARTSREARELEAIARAYTIASRDEVALIALTPTIAAGGTIVRTRVWNRGTERERRENYLLPRLAACPWQAAFCYSLGIQRDGSIEFIDSLERTFRYQSGRVHLQTGFELPHGFEAGRRIDRDWRGWRAMVPIVPPRHRPAATSDRLILFEVEDWQWAELPQPPGDPALLRHVGGDIYAVEAVWDLTELEKLVLSGRRPE